MADSRLESGPSKPNRRKSAQRVGKLISAICLNVITVIGPWGVQQSPFLNNRDRLHLLQVYEVASLKMSRECLVNVIALSKGLLAAAERKDESIMKADPGTGASGMTPPRSEAPPRGGSENARR